MLCWFRCRLLANVELRLTSCYVAVVVRYCCCCVVVILLLMLRSHGIHCIIKLAWIGKMLKAYALASMAKCWSECSKCWPGLAKCWRLMPCASKLLANVVSWEFYSKWYHMHMHSWVAFRSRIIIVVVLMCRFIYVVVVVHSCEIVVMLRWKCCCDIIVVIANCWYLCCCNRCWYCRYNCCLDYVKRWIIWSTF